MFERSVEQEMLPYCRAHHVGLVPFFPLAGGFLTGKYQRGKEAPPDARLAKPVAIYSHIFTDENWNKLAELEAFAVARGHTTSELAIAWLLAQEWISSVIAGARTVGQLSANLPAMLWKLTDDDLARLSQIE